MSTGAYNTTHLRSLLAPLICFFFIDQFFIFCLSVVVVFSSSSFFLFSLGAAIGYLMQIFFISLHFLYS